MDAEAYPETSRTVLKILWCAGTTVRPAHDAQWAKARASAFEALTQYDVNLLKCCKCVFQELIPYCDHFMPF